MLSYSQASEFDPVPGLSQRLIRLIERVLINAHQAEQAREQSEQRSGRTQHHQGGGNGSVGRSKRSNGPSIDACSARFITAAERTANGNSGSCCRKNVAQEPSQKSIDSNTSNRDPVRI